VSAKPTTAGEHWLSRQLADIRAEIAELRAEVRADRASRQLGAPTPEQLDRLRQAAGSGSPEKP